jgi:hypothetical protein
VKSEESGLDLRGIGIKDSGLKVPGSNGSMRQCVSVSKCWCVIVPLCHCVIVSLCHCVNVSVRQCVNASMYQGLGVIGVMSEHERGERGVGECQTARGREIFREGYSNGQCGVNHPGGASPYLASIPRPRAIRDRASVPGEGERVSAWGERERRVRARSSGRGGLERASE